MLQVHYVYVMWMCAQWAPVCFFRWYDSKVKLLKDQLQGYDLIFSLSPNIGFDGVLLVHLKATLDERPKSRVPWNRAILLDKSHNLDPWPLDEGPQSKSGKLSLNLIDTILEGRSIGLNPKRNFKKKGELMIWRTKMHTR